MLAQYQALFARHALYLNPGGEVVGRFHQHLGFFHDGQHGVGHVKQPGRSRYNVVENLLAASVQQLVAGEGLEACLVIGRNQEVR